MALSTISTLKLNPLILPKLATKPSNSLPPSPSLSPSASSFRCCSSPKPNPPTNTRRAFDMGIGLFAASVVGLTPFDAVATRIEYYATVSDPPCEFNFVKSGLGYCDVVAGYGEVAPFGELINVHYTARFADGIVFDSSYKRGRYLTMRIGIGKLIKGLDQGIAGGEGVPPMLVGGKRKLKIPPKLAYGPEAAGCFSGDCNIPGNATLVYDIHFVEVYKGNRAR
ncbi:hypothetical protein RHSIM_Rhsim10G0156600 [Rhododendron simsii]|uniref:peptidylprolyl isomerase n=1 Tax=Rhododendron simsii TaxID=118357 RepID=A0A834LCW5_RHOSS|nr:hypothetical protein RHSIM_Rhsim10G0156600 [Rhododendron simsii]